MVASGQIVHFSDRSTKFWCEVWSSLRKTTEAHKLCLGQSAQIGLEVNNPKSLQAKKLLQI